MTNEVMKTQLDDLLDFADKQMASARRLQRQRLLLTATASAADKRVTVTVNADNTIVETRLAEDIDELTPAEIARAVTAAAQDAAAEIARRTAELMADRPRPPDLREYVDGAPDLGKFFLRPERASIAPPGSPERNRLAAAYTADYGDTAIRAEHDHDSVSDIHDSVW
ncbi:YbaB/EbfC family nucleoid-associated protein [Nocardia sp. NPDC127526]|uniref:YbaB/EbfC family nucleoid-associated protein n=1 Tax=Nocardia sp. NPDC127526 TaxID=3345393 RepID=UPI00363D1708